MYRRAEGVGMKIQTDGRFLYAGVIWTVIFAGISFYWASGGMIGARSLGGSIYRLALHPTPGFTAMIWTTGVIKLFGALLLMLLLIKWRNPAIRKVLYLITRFSGLLLFLYGLLNFTTISLSAAGFLNFALGEYATFWRLAFWEPLWMIGGIFYFFAVKKKSNRSLEAAD